MRRYSSHLTAIAGLAVAVILLAAGGLLTWGSAYVHNTVQGQLASQQIFFPPKAAFANPKAGTEITPSMVPSVSQYAGEQMLTGQQAEAYADHFIAVHVAEAGGGKTYSQLSTESQAAPTNTKLAGTVATVFKGETLRSMLLNAYGWWKVSQITYIAALVAFALGGLTLIGSAFALALGRRPEITHEAIPATGPTPAPVASPRIAPPATPSGQRPSGCWPEDCDSPARADPAAGDAGRGDTHEQLPFPTRPGLDSGRSGRRTLGLGFHVMRRSLDQHAPALAPGGVDVVDLERHLVVPAHDPGLQVLIHRTVLGGPEHDRPVVPLVVHRQHRRTEPALVGDAADSAPRYQPQALGLLEFLDRAVRHA